VWVSGNTLTGRANAQFFFNGACNFMWDVQ
jgi:hypothetical protein